MRLIVARCEVSYAGRLSTVLPEAVRLLMVKPDGTFMVWSDGGGSSVKPLNWMTPPTVIEEHHEDGRLARLTVRARGQEDRLELTIAEVLSDVEHELDTRAGLEKEGVERELQLLLAASPAALRRGLPAGPPRVAHRHRPRGPDVPRPARTNGWRSRSSATGRSRPSSS